MSHELFFVYPYCARYSIAILWQYVFDTLGFKVVKKWELIFRLRTILYGIAIIDWLVSRLLDCLNFVICSYVSCMVLENH